MSHQTERLPYDVGTEAYYQKNGLKITPIPKGTGDMKSGISAGRRLKRAMATRLILPQGNSKTDRKILRPGATRASRQAG